MGWKAETASVRKTQVLLLSTQFFKIIEIEVYIGYNKFRKAIEKGGTNSPWMIYFHMLLI